MKRTRLATLAVGIAVSTALTGCGGDDDGGTDNGGDNGGDSSGFADESAEDIVAAAKEAMGGLESVHLQGDLTTDSTEISMDLSLSTTGNCVGEVTLDGGALEVLKVEGDAWFKADAAFWESQAGAQAEQIIAAVGDKWVVDSAGQFTSFCDLDGLLEELVSDDEDKTFEKDGTEDVDGADAVKIVGDDSIAFIATDDPHYVLQVEGTEEGEEGAMTFSAFDEEIDVEAPAEDDVVDLDQLG